MPKHRNKIFNVHQNTQKWQQHICQNSEIYCSMYTKIHKNGINTIAKTPKYIAQRIQKYSKMAHIHLPK